MSPTRRAGGALVLAIALACTTQALAQDTEAMSAPGEDVAARETDAEADEGSEPLFGAEGIVSPPDPLPEARAATRVTREEAWERGARSAPDALRYVPGVTVQQTTHGQASPFVRGMTGQQVLVLFDGIRLNNGLFRQGPNQYFFTVDLATLERIDVIRGSASTRYGADAIGGAILASPLAPTLDAERDGLTLHPSAIGRFGSQDLDASGRLELDAQLGRDVAVLVGGGYRAASALEGSGVLTNADGSAARVPYVEADGRTQRGTGFRYATFDARLVARVAPALRFVAALYGFRQYDTPRADQCPAYSAPERDCLRFTEQFRTLAYVGLRGAAGADFPTVAVTLSYQRQHELRNHDRPTSFVDNEFRDDVDSFGLTASFESRRLGIVGDATLRVRFGGEGYVDQVHSAAWLTFTDLQITRQLSRGQYADGSRYATLGAFVEGELSLGETLTLIGAARLAYVGARASADPDSATASVDGNYGGVTARAAAAWHPSREVTVALNVDRGFRAPNLDDLTSRQQAGPGFQYENAGLGPETSLTYELGVRADLDVVRFDAWVFATEIDAAITRSVRSVMDCPTGAPECQASWSRYQLINATSASWILGTELSALVTTDVGFSASATLAYAWGEGPNLSSPPTDPTIPFDQRVPLSRIPPLQGTVELRYTHPELHVYGGAAVRWATAQDRLAIADASDPRIPIGGTPGYGLLDLRAGFRFDPYVRVQLAFENVLDQVYRVHGSGINGAGRGFSASVELAY